MAHSAWLEPILKEVGLRFSSSVNNKNCFRLAKAKFRSILCSSYRNGEGVSNVQHWHQDVQLNCLAFSLFLCVFWVFFFFFFFFFFLERVEGCGRERKGGGGGEGGGGGAGQMWPLYMPEDWPTNLPDGGRSILAPTIWRNIVCLTLRIEAPWDEWI